MSQFASQRLVRITAAGALGAALLVGGSAAGAQAAAPAAASAAPAAARVSATGVSAADRIAFNSAVRQARQTCQSQVKAAWTAFRTSTAPAKAVKHSAIVASRGLTPKSAGVAARQAARDVYQAAIANDRTARITLAMEARADRDAAIDAAYQTYMTALGSDGSARSKIAAARVTYRLARNDATRTFTNAVFQARMTFNKDTKPARRALHLALADAASPADRAAAYTAYRDAAASAAATFSGTTAAAAAAFRLAQSDARTAFTAALTAATSPV